jgi:ribonuclease G
VKLLASCSPGEVRVAAVDERMRDYALWRPSRPDGVGDIHRGRIVATARALGGSFVALIDGEGFLPRSAQEARLSEGETVLVRVTRAAQGGKERRLAAVAHADGVAGKIALLQRGPGALALLAARFPLAPILIDDAAVAARLHAILGNRITVVARAFDDATEDDVAQLAEPLAPLPGGGQLAIEPTRALVAIDVDSGGGLGAGDKAAAHAGFNAAILPELARQIRLRNLSGAIVVDFAGLSARRRQALVAPLQAALADDPQGCRLVGFTGLGLAELVRKRVHPPLHEALSGAFATALRALRAAVAQAPRAGTLVLCCAPAVIGAIEQDAAIREDIARSAAHGLRLEADPSMAEGVFRIAMKEGRGV